MFQRFNAIFLTKRLSVLDEARQVAFGASVCEALLPNYSRFRAEEGLSDDATLVRALEAVWDSLQKDNKSADFIIKRSIEDCERMAPNSNESASIFLTSAQDACFAICALLDYLMAPNSERITQVAAYATDSVDLYVQEIEKMMPNDSDLEAKILAHPLMQQELRRQEQILTMLEGTVSWSEVNVAALKSVAINNELGNLVLV